MLEEIMEGILAKIMEKNKKPLTVFLALQKVIENMIENEKEIMDEAEIVTSQVYADMLLGVGICPDDDKDRDIWFRRELDDEHCCDGIEGCELPFHEEEV